MKWDVFYRFVDPIFETRPLLWGNVPVKNVKKAYGLFRSVRMPKGPLGLQYRGVFVYRDRALRDRAHNVTKGAFIDKSGPIHGNLPGSKLFGQHIYIQSMPLWVQILNLGSTGHAATALFWLHVLCFTILKANTQIEPRKAFFLTNMDLFMGISQD